MRKEQSQGKQGEYLHGDVVKKRRPAGREHTTGYKEAIQAFLASGGGPAEVIETLADLLAGCTFGDQAAQEYLRDEVAVELRMIYS